MEEKLDKKDISAIIYVMIMIVVFTLAL